MYGFSDMNSPSKHGDAVTRPDSYAPSSPRNRLMPLSLIPTDPIYSADIAIRLFISQYKHRCLPNSSCQRVVKSLFHGNIQT